MATFTMTAYSKLWRDRQGRFASVAYGAREYLAASIQELSRAAMQRLIYSKPEDESTTGRKLWVRTGQLLNNEKSLLKGDGEIVLTNATDYAEPRHEAGKPGRRAINPARFAPWRDVMQDTFRQLQLAIYENAIQEWLQGTGIMKGGSGVGGAAAAGAAGASSAPKALSAKQVRNLQTKIARALAQADAAIGRDQAAFRREVEGRARAAGRGRDHSHSTREETRAERAAGGHGGGGAIPLGRPHPRKPRRLFPHRFPKSKR
jgi:hypothetical protein